MIVIAVKTKQTVFTLCLHCNYNMFTCLKQKFYYQSEEVGNVKFVTINLFCVTFVLFVFCCVLFKAGFHITANCLRSCLNQSVCGYLQPSTIYKQFVTCL